MIVIFHYYILYFQKEPDVEILSSFIPPKKDASRNLLNMTTSNSVYVRPIKLHQRTIPCIIKAGIQYVLVETVRRAYFPQCSLRAFMFMVDRCVSPFIYDLNQEDIATIMRFAKNPVSLLKCSKVISVRDANQVLPMIRNFLVRVEQQRNLRNTRDQTTGQKRKHELGLLAKQYLPNNLGTRGLPTNTNHPDMVRHQFMSCRASKPASSSAVCETSGVESSDLPHTPVKHISSAPTPNSTCAAEIDSSQTNFEQYVTNGDTIGNHSGKTSDGIHLYVNSKSADDKQHCFSNPDTTNMNESDENIDSPNIAFNKNSEQSEEKDPLMCTSEALSLAHSFGNVFGESTDESAQIKLSKDSTLYELFSGSNDNAYSQKRSTEQSSDAHDK